MSLRIAYFINEYPKISHSFIRREILALERQGFEILRISLHGWDTPLTDEEDKKEREQTLYVLKNGLLSLLFAMLRSLVKRPRRFFIALKLVVQVGWRADRPLPYHLAYLAEACHILPWLHSFGATHMHAHFGTNSAEVAMLTHALGGPTYSFTVHGQDELLSAGIREKVNQAEFVAAISSFGRSLLYHRTDYTQWPKVRLVHCGLEKAFYDHAPVTMPIEPRLVCVGRLCAEKGQLLLIEAANRLFAKGISFKLVLAGDGDMRPDVEKLIAGYKLSDQIRITGWISSSQVRQEILAARAMVLPSFTEGLPVVIMEAMALRRPVLSTFVGGIPELVLPAETGWLFPAGSIDELAAAMENCLAQPHNVLERMGNAGYLRVLERHDIDIEARKLALLFSKSGNKPH